MVEERRDKTHAGDTDTDMPKSINSRVDEPSSEKKGICARLDKLEAKSESQKSVLAQLDAKNERIRSGLDELKARIDRHDVVLGLHGPMWQSILNVRESIFLTWREHGTGSQSRTPDTSSALTRDEFQDVNGSVLHGGNAIADAIMLKERRHMDRIKGFMELYGLSPDQIKTIGNAASIFIIIAFPSLTLTPIADSKRFDSILNVLNAVGGFHLGGMCHTGGKEDLQGGRQAGPRQEI